MKVSKRGQGTLEYVIILAAVIGAIIAVASALRPKIVNSYDVLGDRMETTVNGVNFD